MALLVSTLGRPTMAIKTRLQVIFKYNVTNVLGLIPKGDRKKDLVLNSILSGWENEKDNIQQNSTVKISEHEIDLDFFFFQDSNRLSNYSMIDRDAELLKLATEILKSIKNNEISTIIFDIASGRRILSGICLSIARLLQDIARFSDTKMSSRLLDKLRSVNFVILTRPTPTQRLYVDAKQLKEGETPPLELKSEKKRPEAGIHELIFHPYPILKFMENDIIQMWNIKESQREIGKYIAKKFGLKEDSGIKKVTSFKKRVLTDTNFADVDNSNKLTISGIAFREFYGVLMDNGT